MSTMSHPVSTPGLRSSRLLAPALICAMLALAGCGTSGKGAYQGASAQAGRNAAEALVEEAGAASTLQTQATYVQLVEQIQRDGSWFASLAHLDALERKWGATPLTIRLRADALRQTAQPEESRREYARLLDTPQAAAAYHGLGLLAGANENFVEAIELLTLARQNDPTDALVLSDLGYASLRAGRPAAARVPLMQASQLAPGNPKVQANLALYLLVTKQERQAEALMTSQGLPPDRRRAVRDAARQLPSMVSKAGSSLADHTPVRKDQP
jgi:Flp pilus assembly protein TadD